MFSYRAISLRTGIAPGLLLTLLLLLPASLRAQAPVDTAEVAVQVTVRRLGTTMLPSLIVGTEVYLPVRGLFGFLKVKAIPSADGDTLSGFFIEEENLYTIDIAHAAIDIDGDHVLLGPADLIRTEQEIYLHRRIFSTVFKLDCSFDFRSLSVQLSCDRELPAVRDLLREKAHQGLVKRETTMLADRVVGSSHGAFHLGTLDWAVGSLRSSESHSEFYTVSAGAGLLGGDVDGSIIGSFGAPVEWSKQPWRWRYVHPGGSLFTQATIGSDIPLPFASFSSSLAGVQVTNRPINRRRGFGTYHLSGNTEPGWMVDLYVNGELSTFASADPSGRYDFEVPLAYGATTVGLKFYGPWGEEREREELIQVPFTFLPEHELEYSFVTGKLKGAVPHTVSQLLVQDGINADLTVGGGLQYVRELGSRPLAAYAGASYRLTDQVLLTADYVTGYRTRGIITYASPKGLTFEGSYTHYHRDQQMGAIGGLETRKIAVISPVHLVLPMSTRLSLSQDLIDAHNWVVSGEGGITTALGGLQTNLAMNTVFYRRDGALALHTLRTTLSLSKGIFWQMVMRSQMQYDLASGQLLTLGAAVDRGVFDLGYLTLSIERSFVDRRLSAQLDFRYDLPFAGMHMSIVGTDRTIALDQTMHGTLSFDESTGDFLVGNRSTVGRGGITLRTFLDENNNGIFDAGEKPVQNLDVKVTGGRLLDGDVGITRVVDLEPYDSCAIRLSGGNLEYLSWQPKFHSVNVMVDPNHFKEVPVPIVIGGEVGGTVSRMTAQGLAGQGGIRVLFESSDGVIVDSALSFSDGEYTFMGLPPGKYRAYPDPKQLEFLKMRAEPAFVDFELRSLAEGDVVENLNFVLRRSAGAK